MAFGRLRLLPVRDDDLIARSVAGDASAADKLLARYKDDVYGIVRRLVDDNDMAEDILVEVLTELYQSLGTFKGRSSFRTWLYRITVNVSLEHLRRTRPPIAVSWAEEMPDPNGDVAEVVVRKAQAEAIEGAIRSLSDKLRPVVSLYYLGECTCREIGQILEIPRATVKSRLFSGTQQIKDRLQEGGET